MIVAKNSPLHRATMRGYGLAPITLNPESVVQGTPNITPASTSTTSGTPAVTHTPISVQPVTLAQPMYAIGGGPITPDTVDPQSPQAVHARGGVAAGDAWSLPTDKPWSTVFDADFYYSQYPDLQMLVGNEYGSNPKWLLWWHFVNSGINEGRIASPNWSVQQYLANYPDLMKAYNDPNWWNHNPTTVLNHWFNNGIKEKRSGAPLPAAGTPVAVTPAGPSTLPTTPVAGTAMTDADLFKCILDGGSPVNGQCIYGGGGPNDWGTNIEQPVRIMITPELCAAQGQGYSTSDEYGTPNHPRCTGKQQPYAVPVTLGPVPPGSAVIGESWKRNLKLAGAAAALYFFFIRKS